MKNFIINAIILDRLEGNENLQELNINACIPAENLSQALEIFNSSYNVIEIISYI